jgi:preprotein translocase subunit SecG
MTVAAVAASQTISSAAVILLILLQVEESKPYVKQYGQQRLPKYMQVVGCQECG